MAIDRNKVLKAAQKHIRKRNWDKALREYVTLVDDDPTDMRSLLKCGDLHVKLDDIAQALRAYKSVADSYAQQDMYEKAIAVYKQAQRLDESDVALHYAIGECYFRLGRLKDAIRSFHAAQKMYKALGDIDAQREILEHMVRIDPDDVGLRIQLAERYTKDGYKNEALDAFAFCASKLEEEGRLDELLQVLERTLYLSPDRSDLRKTVVRLYLDRQDNQAALKHLQIAFREMPEDIETMELLAQTFERLDRKEKAVLVLQELVPLYLANNRQSDAENLYRRLLRLDPTNVLALRALGPQEAPGPDSDVLSPLDTGSLSQARRQNTPAPMETLEGVEFLDDDIEFLDDDLVPEAVPAAFSRQSTAVRDSPALPPQAQAPAPSSPMIHEIADADDFMDLDLDAFDSLEEAFNPPNRRAPGEEPQLVQEIDALAIGDIEEIDLLEPIEAESLSEEDVRTMLKECDVFLRYGLLDKAEKAIREALSFAPESIVAHEKLVDLHRATGNRDQAYRALITLSEFTQCQPIRAHGFLTRALDFAANPTAVYVRAEALGIDLHGPPPVDDLEEISMEVLEVVAPEKAPSTLLVDANEFGSFQDEPASMEGISFLDPDDTGVVFLDSDNIGVEEIDFLDDSADLLDGTLDEINSAIENYDPQGLASSTAAEVLNMNDIELLEEELGGDTDAELLDGSGFDDLDDLDLLEMDLDAEVGISELDLASLEDVEDDETDQPAVNSLFADVEADDLFDDLFGDITNDGPLNLGGDDPMGELAEIDFFIQQGLSEEASEALASFEILNPSHPGLKQRRFQVRQIRQGGALVDGNPFGSRSLSQKFNPNISTGKVEAANFNDLVNSNLELGVAYRDMGLLDEAIEEFKQALDDPEAAPTAQLNIALCEIDLGKSESARNSLRQLLAMDGVSHDVLMTAREMLSEI